MSDSSYSSKLSKLDHLKNIKGSVNTSYIYGTPLSQDRLESLILLVEENIESEKRKKDKNKKPAILNLPKNATRNEVNNARITQAVKQGSAVYLPLWSEGCRGIPSSFLRSALFSTEDGVQQRKDSSGVREINKSCTEVKLASLGNISIVLTGAHLCQKDRQVFSTCLDYYRERPLAAVGSNDFVRTTFYEFCKRTGVSYGVNPHKSILASLLRLQCVRLSVRHDHWNFSGSMLEVKFGDNDEERKGSDELCIQVSENIAELFGVGAWTAVDMKTASYRGLLGWTANFYASHSDRNYEYSFDYLQELAGYTGTKHNFKQGICSALDKLKNDTVAEKARIYSYEYSEDNKKIRVHKKDKTSSAKKKSA
ncbi:hypothetical protein [Undibacterium sp. WLX3042]|uniref:hypothetical protein n=1 Tax=Undibacterium sp. WLX3042 TaxID=3412686 RepID=UPI003C307B53